MFQVLENMFFGPRKKLIAKKWVIFFVPSKVIFPKKKIFHVGNLFYNINF